MTEDMPRTRPPNLIHERDRHGTWKWYARIGKGPRKRLRQPYGTDAFWREYDSAVAALTGKTVAEAAPTGTESLAWLVARYQDSMAWSHLGPTTRKDRANILKRALEGSAAHPFASITRKHVLAGVDKRRETPSAARHFVDTLRGLFRWALDAEFVKVDPTAGVTVPKQRTEGYHTWTEAEVDAYQAYWPLGTRQRVWLDVLLYSGLRRGDAVTLGRQHVRGGVARLMAEKTGTALEFPILWPLEQSLKAGPVGDMAFIVGEAGRPLTKESFGNLFRDACKAAGVPGSAHGLRKAGATRAASAGASEHQLMAMFGWTDSKTAKVYTQKANRAKLAGDAARMMLSGASRDDNSPHSTSGAGKIAENERKSDA